MDTGAESDWFCGAQKVTNNTGELIGIRQALMWLRDVAANAELSAPSIVEMTAVMLYDSAYAANMVTGRWKASYSITAVVSTMLGADSSALAATSRSHISACPMPISSPVLLVPSLAACC